MKNIPAILSLFFLFLGMDRAFAQNTSNKGREFWLGYGNHVAAYNSNDPSNLPQDMALYITSDVNTKVTVEIPGINFSQTTNVLADNIAIVNIPDQAYLAQQGKSNLGIHVLAERPVVVYSHIYNNAVSGATLALPVNTLGREYYSINYTQVSNDENARSYFFVVAVEDNTEVEITPSADTEGDSDGAWNAGTKKVIKLNKGEVYQVLGKTTGQSQIGIDRQGRPVYDYYGVDLTGSVIKSVSTTNEPCKRIAVFSGSGKIAIGCNSQSRSSDNFYQQLYPTGAWGKNYITAPLKGRNYDVFRIIKSNASAVVKLDTTTIPAGAFINNLYYEFQSTTPHSITSDKPIQVVQYAVTQNQAVACGNSTEAEGDPEMIFLNPVEQNIDKITVYSSPFYAINRHFINVVMETANIGGFTLDGMSRSSDFNFIRSDSTFSYAQFEVPSGVHTLAAPTGFNAIAYGFGRAESYGYSAGTNVKSLGLELTSKVTNQIETVGCVGEEFDFNVYLLYQTNKIVWDLGDSVSILTQNNPQPVSTVSKEDKLYYVYRYPNSPLTFSKAGNYSIQVTANKPLADGCGSTEDMATDFSIFDLPTADFRFKDSICAGTAIAFRDSSDGKGAALKSWNWDFGDQFATSTNQNQSDLRNPGHIYTRPGAYQVRLTVSSETTCAPVFRDTVIHVFANPEASFAVSDTICPGRPVRFTDKSSHTRPNSIGFITKWKWRFGDRNATSTNPDSSDLQNPTHIFTVPGDYDVTLTVETSTGCKESSRLKVTVTPLPVADFILPEVCLNDAFAEFTNASKIDDNSALSYLWDFGDATNSTLANPNTSTAKNPRHKYSSVGEYKVRLTVFSSGRCDSTIEKNFTVNGSIPKANFRISNSEICSGEEIIFEDLASVNFGQLTKIEWFLDADSNSSVPDSLDEDPALRSAVSRKYKFRYPEMYTPASKTIKVKMRVYSGGACAADTSFSFILKAKPKVELSPFADICAEADPFPLRQGKQLYNVLSGKETYSGPGVTKTGYFDPGRAGAGIHKLYYSFVSESGCSAIDSREVTILPTPILNAGPEQTILEGEEVQLNAYTSGKNLALKWSGVPASPISRTDIPNPTCRPAETTVYTLEATSGNNCVAVSSVTVRVLKHLKVVNAFTPNNDGKNDTWEIPYLNDYPGCTVDIYNRLGLRVFTSVGYGQPWNGMFNGQTLPAGTYYYIINPGNRVSKIAGNVTIIR